MKQEELNKETVESFKKRKDKMTSVLEELAESLQEGNFNLHVEQISMKDLSFELVICDRLKEFLNKLVLKTKSGTAHKSVSSSIEGTEYNRFRIREGVLMGAQETIPEIALLFEEKLLTTGHSTAIKMSSMSRSRKVVESLTKGIKLIIENLIAYTELEKDTVLDFGYKIEED